MRIAPLDYDTFASITDKDFALYAPFGAHKVCTVTCVDQLGDDGVMVLGNGALARLTTENFKQTMVPRLFEYHSTGPTRDDVNLNF